MTLDELRELTGYRLATMADVGIPDGEHSAGADFVVRVRDAYAEAVQWAREHDESDPDSDALAEIADQSVPVYTADTWRTFVDLAAWGEDITDYVGPGADDMTMRANTALYVIAERLLSALADELDEREDNNDEQEA